MTAGIHGEQKGLSPDEAQRWTRVGALAALAICLGYLETFIPIPIPGVKLGLANIAILIALAQRDAAGAWCIALVKVLAAGLLFGNPLTMAYSAAGTMLALTAMTPLSRLHGMHLVMTSIVGGMLHEAGQLIIAMMLLGTPLVWYSAPVLLLAGALTGLLCGVVAWRTAQLLDERGTSYCAVSSRHAKEPLSLPDTARQNGRQSAISHHPKAFFLCFLVYVIVILHAESPDVLAACLALAAIMCFIARVPARAFGLALRPLAFILAITLVAQVAAFQQGEVLLWLGPVAITSEAVERTAFMCARLLGITACSLAVMHLFSVSQLLDVIAWMLSPLHHVGVRTEGPLFALQVALQTVPVLATTIRDQAKGADIHPTSRTFWETTVPRFIENSYRAASACTSSGMLDVQAAEGVGRS